MKQFNPMSNVIKIALLCSVLYVILTIGFCALASSAMAETYAQTTVVTSVDYDADIVECVDFNGNVWAFKGCEDWQVMDVCAMMMDDNNTATIYDDVIVSARYNGWLDGWMERV